MEEQTPEQIAQHYKALGDSVDLINAVIAGDVDMTLDERRDCVDRNVLHLEIMKAKDFWTNEDFAAVDAAIAAGKAYLG